jgi:hypothetical protein
MTDVVETDPFDDIFSGNGAGGTGLDLVCDQPCILIPQEYKKMSDRKNKDGSDKYMVVTTAVSFSDPTNPEVHNELPVFGNAVADMLKNFALKNAAGEVTEKGFPFMRIAIPFKNKEKGQAGNPMWDFKAVEDQNLIRAMAAYAHKNLKPASPFE